MSLFKKFQEAWNSADLSSPRIPVPKAAAKVTDRASIHRSYLPEPLTVPDKVDLLAISKHPGYEVLLKVMERLCEAKTTDIMNADSANAEAVRSAQIAMKAAWQFYTTLQQAVLIEIDSVSGPQEHFESQSEPDFDDPATIDRLFDPLTAFSTR